MATTLIASGTSAANSADFSLLAGETATIFLTSGADGPIVDSCSVSIGLKSTGGFYTTIGFLDENQPSYVVAGIGTYRARRETTGTAVGVERG